VDSRGAAPACVMRQGAGVGGGTDPEVSGQLRRAALKVGKLLPFPCGLAGPIPHGARQLTATGHHLCSGLAPSSAAATGLCALALVSAGPQAQCTWGSERTFSK
jgi:hypothetical protein